LQPLFGGEETIFAEIATGNFAQVNRYTALKFTVQYMLR
jgi:hypothetical protein